MNPRPMDLKVRMAKATSHPTRVAILEILRERVASPNEVRKELGLGLGLSSVSYHFTLLKEYGCIELVKTEPRCGAVEHYYRAAADLIPEPGVELSQRQRKLLAELIEDTLHDPDAARAALFFPRPVTWAQVSVARYRA